MINMINNKTLGVLVAVLFLLSLLTYRADIGRADRFERGQRFLANLNQDEIVDILITRDDQTTHLRRGSDLFSVVSADGYPARTEAVGRFVKTVLEMELEKEVGSGASLEQELGLTPGDPATTEIVLSDGTGNEMVHFLIGNSLDGGNGNYVRRTDTENATIYLTSSPPRIDSSPMNFLQTEILDVPSDQIQTIRGKDGVLASILSPLLFEQHYLANAPQVSGLHFTEAVIFELDDDSGYRLSLASRDDTDYVRIEAFHKTQQITISQDATEEEASVKAELLERVSEVQAFNDFHGSWVYVISDSKSDMLK
jgi:hypothetical protein